MMIVVGSDHAGFEHKEALKAMLVEEGYTVVDVGTESPDRVDYPDFGVKAAELVANGSVDYGVLVCGSGIGISIAANKVPGGSCRERDQCRDGSNCRVSTTMPTW